MVQYRKRIYDKKKRAFDFWILANAKKLKAIKHLGGCCSNCGNKKFSELGFHHEDEKKENLGKMFRSSKWEEIEKELDSCVLLCENCHREHHYPKSNSKRSQIKKFLLDYKGLHSCKCGYNKNVAALEFHHPSPSDKEFSISKIDKIDESVLTEVDKCEVVCANCHRTIHFDCELFKINENRIIEKSENLKTPNRTYDRQEILDLHDAGKTQIEICKIVGCSPSVVCQILKEHRQHYVSRIDDIEVNNLYLSGLNPNKISKQLGFSRTTVVRSLKRSNTL